MFAYGTKISKDQLSNLIRRRNPSFQYPNHELSLSAIDREDLEGAGLQIWYDEKGAAEDSIVITDNGPSCCWTYCPKKYPFFIGWIGHAAPEVGSMRIQLCKPSCKEIIKLFCDKNNLPPPGYCLICIHCDEPECNR